jgi:HSP20 family protein
MATTMTRWSPFTELADMRDRLERMFEDLDNPSQGWSPAIDIMREKDKYVVRADVPGVRPEDIDVEFDDGVLTVSGEHEEKTEKKEKDYIRRERRFGSFSRSIRLPQGVDADQIDASYNDGVLELTVPMPKRESKAVKITPHS